MLRYTPSKWPEYGGCVHWSTVVGSTGTTSAGSYRLERHESYIHGPWWAAKRMGLSDVLEPFQTYQRPYVLTFVSARVVWLERRVRAWREDIRENISLPTLGDMLPRDNRGRDRMLPIVDPRRQDPCYRTIRFYHYVQWSGFFVAKQKSN